MEEEQPEVVVDLHKLEINGHSIVELLTYDSPLTLEEYRKMYRDKAERLREIGLLAWAEEYGEQVFNKEFPRGRGEFKLHSHVYFEGAHRENRNSLQLTASVSDYSGNHRENQTFIPELIAGRTYGEKAREVMGWDLSETKFYADNVAVEIEGIQVLINFKSRKDAFVRFMRKYKHA